MARSYSYEHFKEQERQNPEGVGREREQAAYAKSHEAALPGDTKIHYGKKYAQTEELAIAHQMNAQLEELAGIEKEEAAPPRAARAEQKPTPQRVGALGAELPDELPRRQGAPIGSLPPPQERMPAGLIKDAWADAGRYLRMLSDAARDARVATTQLLRLPLEVAQIAARRLLPGKV